MLVSLARPSPMATIPKEFVVEDSVDDSSVNKHLRIATPKIGRNRPAVCPARSELTSYTKRFNWPKDKPGWVNCLGLFYSQGFVP